MNTQDLDVFEVTDTVQLHRALSDLQIFRMTFLTRCLR